MANGQFIRLRLEKIEFHRPTISVEVISGGVSIYKEEIVLKLGESVDFADPSDLRPSADPSLVLANYLQGWKNEIDENFDGIYRRLDRHSEGEVVTNDGFEKAIGNLENRLSMIEMDIRNIQNEITDLERNIR